MNAEYSTLEGVPKPKGLKLLTFLAIVFLFGFFVVVVVVVPGVEANTSNSKVIPNPKSQNLTLLNFNSTLYIPELTPRNVTEQINKNNHSITLISSKLSLVNSSHTFSVNLTSSSSEIVDLFSNKSHEVRERICSQVSPSSPLLVKATCGYGYTPPPMSDQGFWKVVFYGRNFQISRITTLLGCPDRCPYSSNCFIKYSMRWEDILNANVVVVFQEDHFLIPKIREKLPPKVILGLYWREAHRTHVSVETQSLVDFEMGVHLHSFVLNPVFIQPPLVLLSRPHRPVGERSKFAIFVASDCETKSFREEYLRRLVERLGGDRVDRFGECFNARLPGHSIEAFQALLSQYKFYFAFENTFQDGYTTEKLFDTLALDILPVYYGAFDAPNITVSPSYIHVKDFSSPEDLAEYLLFLDQNPAAYEAFFSWRTSRPEDIFDPTYLSLVSKQWMGPQEMHAMFNVVGNRNPRRAGACCRLCNREFMQNLSPRIDIRAPWDWERIEKRFF